ncbi:MAG: DUF1573 domain-containing protein [Deltaproteobacteria bacterium]|nr:DUF1573 domain-containing protein [Deltaproteobacteria bacterium]
MTKKLVAFLSCFIGYFIVLHLAFASSVGAGTGPKMVLKDKTFDYGEVWQGETVEHVFTVGNRGDEPLRIKRVAPD